jgi:hypothetical protein
VKGKIWYLLVVNIVLFVFFGFTYFLFFNVQYGFTLPSITIGLPLLVGMFFLAFDSVYMVRRKDEKRGQRGFIIGYVAVMVGMFLFPHMGSFMLSHPARNPQTYTQTEESLVLEQVLKEYSDFYSKEADFTVVYPEFTDSYRNLTYAQLNDKKALIKKRMIDANKRDEYPSVYDYSTISSFVDNFISLNLNITAFEIKSAPEDKYYIDYDYIARFPRGWDYEHKLKNFFRITIDNISIRISRPYYDKDTGLVLTDIGGSVYLFYYHDGKAQILDTLTGYGVFG